MTTQINDKHNVCPVCLLEFPSKKEVAQHFDELHGAISYISCYICEEEIFGGIKNYLLHITANHPGFSPKCGPKIFSKIVEMKKLPSKGNDEAQSKKKPIFGKTSCPICEKEVMPKFLITHIRCFHGIDKYRFYSQKQMCPNCPLAFRRYLLVNHMKTVHNTKIEFPGVTVSKNELGSKRPILVTVKPEVMTSSKAKVTSNSHTNHNSEEQQNTVLYTKRPVERFYNGGNYLKKWYPTASKKSKVKCRMCSKLFSARYLNRHVNNAHTQERLHKCRYCPEEFTKENLLSCHMKYVHQINKLKEKKHMCHTCGSRFHHPYTLRMHIRCIHERKRDHLCDLCGAKFQYLHALKDHKLTHAGIKTFFCKICQKRFMKSASCRKHLRNVHHLEPLGKLNNPLEKDSLLYGRVENLIAEPTVPDDL